MLFFNVLYGWDRHRIIPPEKKGGQEKKRDEKPIGFHPQTPSSLPRHQVTLSQVGLVIASDPAVAGERRNLIDFKFL
jgi:hypothetical protein